MSERLIEALPPAGGADIKPELNIDRPVAQKEGVGRRQKDGVRGACQPGR